MDTLTVRQKFILNNLIEKGPLNIKGLSQQIDVSERTILREVSSINNWMKQYDLRIADSGGKIQINGSSKALENIRELFDGIPHLWMLTQEQRQVLITAQLLLSKEPIKSAYFSYQFNVVEGTIIFYLDKIESWLRTKNLNLVRRRGYGLEVEGSDWNKRNAFAELLYNYKSISELLAFLYEDSSDYLLNTFFRVTFGEELILKVKRILKKLYSKDNIPAADDVGYFGAFIHLLLAIERTNSNIPIELPEYLVSDTLSLDDVSFIRKVDRLLEENGIKLPDSELAYLAIHLNGDNNINKEDSGPKELGFDLDESIREIVNIVCRKLNVNIECDEQLTMGLKQHINPALYRLTMGLEVRNPVINEIREYYSELFEAVDYACRLVFSKYNLAIPPNELGYVTMHIGAAIERQHVYESRLHVLIICPNGISTARILCSRLRSRFPEIDEIDVCSLRDMDEKIRDGYDLVLSTVDINKELYSEITVISPLMHDKDVEKISVLIKGKTGSTKNMNKKLTEVFDLEEAESGDDFDTADNLLKNFRIKKVRADSIQAAIKTISDELHSSGFIGKSSTVERQIRNREEKGSVVIPGSHVALIHIRTEEIETPFVGVYRLEHFIEMKSIGISRESVDTIFVMLARRNESSYILEILGKISVAMVEDSSFTNILRLGDIIDIRNELVEIINKEES